MVKKNGGEINLSEKHKKTEKNFIFAKNLP